MGWTNDNTPTSVFELELWKNDPKVQKLDNPDELHIIKDDFPNIDIHSIKRQLQLDCLKMHSIKRMQDECIVTLNGGCHHITHDVLPGIKEVQVTRKTAYENCCRKRML